MGYSVDVKVIANPVTDGIGKGTDEMSGLPWGGDLILLARQGFGGGPFRAIPIPGTIEPQLRPPGRSQERNGEHQRQLQSGLEFLGTLDAAVEEKLNQEGQGNAQSKPAAGKSHGHFFNPGRG